MENNEAEKRENKGNEQATRLGELSDLVEKNNIQNRGVPKDQEIEKRAESLVEQNTRTLPTLGRTQMSKSRKHRDLPLDSTKTDHHQGIS